MQSTIRMLCVVGLATFGATACTAETGPGDPTSTGPQASKEKTGKTQSALSPACPGGANGGTINSTATGAFSADFFGWCFNGGDTVYVLMIDDYNGSSVGSTAVTAGPDSSWPVPGTIQGTVSGCPIGGTAHFVAFDFAGGISGQSPSFASPACLK